MNFKPASGPLPIDINCVYTFVTSFGHKGKVNLIPTYMKLLVVHSRIKLENDFDLAFNSQALPNIKDLLDLYRD